jgi:lysophospholipase L1-like esterase
MKNFYLYIFILCFVIISVSSFTHYYKYYVLKEHFSNIYSNSNSYSNVYNSEKKYVLLGDSIIKNNSFVKNGKGIDDILNEKTNGNSYCYAKDDSTIVDIYSQLDSIPSDLNNKNTIVFLSVGGNDILNNYVNNDVDTKNTKVLELIFNTYKKLFKSIQTKMDQTKIVLIDIYYPTSIKFSQYKPILEEWNKLISDFASSSNNSNNSNLQVLNISNILIESTDFTLNIEPSETGGEKIANNILLY